jgi:polysaccharide biosynthesis/export protein
VIKKLVGVLLASACVAHVMAGQEPPAKPASMSKPLAAATAGAAGGGGAGAAAPLANNANNDPRADGAAAPFQIGPEDILDISVWKNPELSRTVPVRPDGKVSLPLVNDIQAAGLTPATLREQVTERLAEFIPAPEVSVMVREVHSRKVAVVGAVKTPGRFELKSPMTVLEVIALAQGFTDFASRDRIVVLRQNGTTTVRVPFNYRKIADGVDQDNFFVKPGDVVVVP